MSSVVIVTEDGETIKATFAEGAAAKSFIELLPMTLTLEDYANTEKVSDLPKRLSTKGEPSGIDPDVGDITYYAPWGNLAIFYKDFGYASGLVKLGTIDSGLDYLKKKGSFEVTIKLDDKSE